MRSITVIGFTLLTHSLAFGATELRADPPTLYTFEDKAVRFTVKPSSAKEKEAFQTKKLALVSLKDGKIDKYIGVINDGGIGGDLTPGDELYSRKVRFKFKKPGAYEFALIDEGVPFQRGEAAQSLKTVKLHAIPRPTLVKILGEIWEKVRLQLGS